MNLRFSSGWNPPKNEYLGAMEPQSWDLEATPDWIKNGEDNFSKEPSWFNQNEAVLSFVDGLAKWFPAFAPLINISTSIARNNVNRQKAEWVNAQNRFESRRADWYNSPAQQIKRLKKAGLNPFMQSYVKSYPANIPPVESPEVSAPPYSNESVSSFINALTNAAVAEHRIANLDSLTAINDYKENYLYPQLYEANGYANTIASLQVAWENKNYDYERVLKQNLLETQFGFSLANLGEKIIELRPNDGNYYTMIDPVNFQIWIEDENGNKVDTTNWKLSDYPIAYQKAWNEVFRQQDLTNAQIDRIITEANTSSALAALYNANRLKVEQYTTEFEKYGTWPDSDAYLRAAAGAIPWEYINKMQANKLGWSAANAAVGLGVDASKIVLNKGLGSYFGKKAIPQTFKLPKGAKPFINADFNSYSTPYNYNFIY